MSEQITHYTHCCATCRHAEAGGPCAWRHDNADGDCCPDWEYGNHAAWLGDDTPYPMASREITAEPHGSMEEHTALCEHTRVESLPDRRKQLPHHVMVLHSQKGLLAAAALAYRYGKELHPAGTAAKLQELAKERDARIVELEAQVAAFRAPAEAAGYTVSADGKCWTGNGGGREFFQGPPINVTHREEPETVDHLAEAQEHLAEIGTQSLAGDNEIGAAMQSIAHAAIAQAELRGGGSGRVTDTCDGCKHLRVDHRRSVLWCFYLQRDLPTTEYGTQVRDDECPLREDGEQE